MPSSPADWTDDELVAGLRAGGPVVERAAAELFARYAALLCDEARRRRVPPPHDRELAMDVLASALEVLRRPSAPVPASLPAYLVVAVRRRALNRVRAERRAAAREAALAHELADASLATALPDESVSGPASPLALLAAHLDAALDDGERQLLHWLGDYVPQREMAAWLGVTHGAARMRVARLRQRLRALAQAFAATRGPHERLAIERFLQRVASPAPTSTARLARGRSHGSSS